MARKRLLVEKRNILNDIIAREFTLQELRLFSVYLGRINARDLTTRIVRLPLKRFYRVMDFYPQRIEYLKSITRSLLTKVVQIPTPTGGYSQFQLFKECCVEKDIYGEWYFEIDAHDKALPLMFDYKRDYFTYELWNVLNLESINQFRMYEILKAYEKRGGERIISVTDLKALLGIGENEYQKFNDFKRFVLDACQEALKENTDISYTYQPHSRGGRGKIQSLCFTITANKDYKNQLNLEEFLGADAIAEIKQEAESKTAPDISQLAFITALSDKEKAIIMNATGGDVHNIRNAYDIAQQQGNIKNLAGWLIYMVRELQAGRIEPSTEAKKKQPKNRFVNFDQRNIDFAELERLELELLKESMKDDLELADHVILEYD